MKSKLTTILFALGVLAMLGVVVRSLLSGPAYVPTSKDIANAQRTVAPPAGQTDERAPLPELGLIGGAGIVEPAQREARLAGASPGVVSVIDVKEGDQVKQGDVLVDLEGSLE